MQLLVPWINVKENRKHERSLQSPKLGYLPTCIWFEFQPDSGLTKGCEGM